MHVLKKRNFTFIFTHQKYTKPSSTQDHCVAYRESLTLKQPCAHFHTNSHIEREFIVRSTDGHIDCVQLFSDSQLCSFFSNLAKFAKEIN